MEKYERDVIGREGNWGIANHFMEKRAQVDERRSIYWEVRASGHRKSKTPA